jgi:hypothetical protein
MPASRIVGSTLYVAYVCRNPKFPGYESGAQVDDPGFAVFSAVLRFDGVLDFVLGPPSEDRLHEHPFYSLGLKHYGFFEIAGLASIPPGMRRWLVTFHDDTLDVTAASAGVLSRRVDGEATSRIVERIA